jgi:hypothetical protein
MNKVREHKSKAFEKEKTLSVSSAEYFVIGSLYNEILVCSMVRKTP